VSDVRLTKRKVGARVRYWQKRLLLQDVRITIVYGPAPADDEFTAACYASPEYNRAKLHFDLDKIKAAYEEEVKHRKVDFDDFLDEYVYHELEHIPVWPLAKFAWDMAGDNPVLKEQAREKEEALVTYIERLIGALTQEK